MNPLARHLARTHISQVHRNIYPTLWLRQQLGLGENVPYSLSQFNGLQTRHLFSSVLPILNLAPQSSFLPASPIRGDRFSTSSFETMPRKKKKKVPKPRDAAAPQSSSDVQDGVKLETDSKKKKVPNPADAAAPQSSCDAQDGVKLETDSKKKKVPSPGDAAAPQSSCDAQDDVKLETDSKKRQREPSTSSMERKRSKPDTYRKQGHGHRDWIRRNWMCMHDSRLPSGVTFSLMSYNVLAQGLLEEHFYMYYHCRKEYLKWEYRRNKLIHDIEHHKPDIICMQEVQGDHFYSFYEPQLTRLGYECLYKKRTQGRVDGCATFFNKHKFSLDLSVPVEYFRPGIQVLDRDNVGLVVLLKPHVPSPHKSKTKAAKQDQTRLCVANTHLLFNPRRGDVKLAQLCLLLAEIDKVSAKSDLSGFHPVIMCGDMNCCPKSPLYNFLVGHPMNLQGLTGQVMSGQEGGYHGRSISMSPMVLPPRIGIYDQCQYMSEVTKRLGIVANKNGAFKETKSKTDTGSVEDGKPAAHKMWRNKNCSNTLGSGVISHNLKFISVYGQKTERDSKQCDTVTTKHGHSECMVDYIFYSVANKEGRVGCHPGIRERYHFEEGCLKLLSKLDLFTCEEARRIGGFPNRLYPSDHIPLMADFRLCYY